MGLSRSSQRAHAGTGETRRGSASSGPGHPRRRRLNNEAGIKPDAVHLLNSPSVRDLTNTDIVMNWNFWIGTYPGLTRPMLDFVVDSIREYMAEAAR